ncbi:hypothetical protein BWQ96_09411 [Gracilariopsis chorda]|uniref:Uncharacterized protein n=1 Tax=Gracilariopsis chorda TaxID=448386 RepID=A0A2V3IFJ8_9FLOR|nr:hypothetical protein BWQ96_09411 [Gracilariopsis chorda]|eukprot:PXF40866.1 hypothetical protein BWQ96_09411 [Gracilariopsis chorda]
MRFELQDQLLEALKSRQYSSDDSQNSAIAEAPSVDTETPMQKLELRERGAILQNLHDRYKKEVDDGNEQVSSLRERLIIKECITQEAREAADEKSILSLISQLKEKK